MLVGAIEVVNDAGVVPVDVHLGIARGAFNPHAAVDGRLLLRRDAALRGRLLIALLWIALLRITLRRITLRRITLRRIALRRIALRRIGVARGVGIPRIAISVRIPVRIPVVVRIWV